MMSDKELTDSSHLVIDHDPPSCEQLKSRKLCRKCACSQKERNAEEASL